MPSDRCGMPASGTGPRDRRRTRQLALVLAAVRESGSDHPTAERVHRRVRRTLPRVSLGTVYRNLQRLAGEGTIAIANVGARPLRYDPVPSPHDHFVCRACGSIVDLPALGPRLHLRRLRRAGHRVDTHATVVYGRCRGCREEC